MLYVVVGLILAYYYKGNSKIKLFSTFFLITTSTSSKDVLPITNTWYSTWYISGSTKQNQAQFKFIFNNLL